MQVYDNFSDFNSVIDHLNLKLSLFVGILHVLSSGFCKFIIFEILNFHPWILLCVL